VSEGLGAVKGHRLAACCRHAAVAGALAAALIAGTFHAGATTPVNRRAAAADGPPVAEYDVKAAFLFNFAKFVEWPETALGGLSEPLAFCVARARPDSNLPFQAVLAATVRGQKAAGHPTEVREFGTGRCHVLFVGERERRELPALQQELHGGAVLLVGEWNGFLHAGGHVNFVVEGNRVRFDVNPANAAQAGLRISSRLLALARVVYHQAGGG
jgi:hypothetical protein